MRHPIQPVEEDSKGVLRFKKNKIVEKLLDDGPFDLNDIAYWDVSVDDRRQFAQLIGYSLSGFGDLSCCDNETYEAAYSMSQNSKSELQARLGYFRELIEGLKTHLTTPMAMLFECHPDDFMEET